MINAVSPASSVTAVTTVEAAAPVRRADPEPAATKVTVSSSGARAAQAGDWAKAMTGTIHTTADTNQDGTVSDQEQQTEVAKAAMQRAMLEGSANLQEAMQAYQAIASLSDVQR
ncbi:MAG TPA: hypothetical protein VGE36_20050 [Roseateles sp.]